MLHHITTEYSLVERFHSDSDENLEFKISTGFEVPILG